MSQIDHDTARRWQKHWDKVLDNVGLSMARGAKIPLRPKNPPPKLRHTADPAPITPGPGQRVYICVLCRTQTALGREAFAQGQPHPKCLRCGGTFRRLKTQPQPPQATRNLPADPNEPCPF